MKPKRVKVREMEITVKAVPLPTYKIKKDSHPDKFTYDDLKQIRINVSKLMDKYYGYLRQTVSNITLRGFTVRACLSLFEHSLQSQRDLFK